MMFTRLVYCNPIFMLTIRLGAVMYKKKDVVIVFWLIVGVCSRKGFNSFENIPSSEVMLCIIKMAVLNLTKHLVK